MSGAAGSPLRAIVNSRFATGRFVGLLARSFRPGRCQGMGTETGPGRPGPVLHLVLRLGGMNWPLVGVLALAYYVVSPVFDAGYNGDDIVNSFTRGAMTFRGVTLTQYTYEIARAWARDGRFFPLAFAEVYGLFYLFPDYYAYRWLVVGLVLANVLSFRYLTRLVTGSGGLATAASLLVVATFQVRLTHDPVAGYSGLMQVVLLYLTGSLICLWKHFETGRLWWLIPGSLAYALGCLTYEATVGLFAIHAAVVLYHRPGLARSVVAVLPYVCVLAAYLATWGYLRAQAADRIAPDSLYRLRPDPTFVLPAYGDQVFAALPLSYSACHPRKLMRPDTLSDVLRAHRVGFILTLAVAAVVFYRAARERRVWLGRGAALAGFIGLSLWLLAGLPVALVYRYQNELTLGIGYLPVYLQGYGVGLLLALLFSLAAAAVGTSRLVTALAAMIPAGVTATIIVVTADSNAAVAELFVGRGDQFDRRLNVEAALDAGLAADVPEYATVLVANEYPGWHDGISGSHFFCQHTGKRLNVVGRRTVAARPDRPPFADCYLAAGIPPVRRHLYEEIDFAAGKERGLVVLCHLAGSRDWALALTASGTETRAAGHVRVFVRDRGTTPAPFRLAARYAGGDRARVVVPSGTMDVIARGRGWAIYGLDCTARPLDTATIAPVEEP